MHSFVPFDRHLIGLFCAPRRKVIWNWQLFKCLHLRLGLSCAASLRKVAAKRKNVLNGKVALADVVGINLYSFQ